MHAGDDRFDQLLGHAHVGVRVPQADRADPRRVAADRAGEQLAQVIGRDAVLLAQAHEQARLAAIRGRRLAFRAGRLVLRGLGLVAALGLVIAIAVTAAALAAAVARTLARLLAFARFARSGAFGRRGGGLVGRF